MGRQEAPMSSMDQMETQEEAEAMIRPQMIHRSQKYTHCPICWKRIPDEPTADDICHGLYANRFRLALLRLRHWFAP